MAAATNQPPFFHRKIQTESAVGPIFLFARTSEFGRSLTFNNVIIMTKLFEASLGKLLGQKTGVSEIKERRKVKDRRAYNQEKDQAYPYNRRIRPCRRLNNISVRWHPSDES